MKITHNLGSGNIDIIIVSFYGDEIIFWYLSKKSQSFNRIKEDMGMWHIKHKI